MHFDAICLRSANCSCQITIVCIFVSDEQKVSLAPWSKAKSRCRIIDGIKAWLETPISCHLAQKRTEQVEVTRKIAIIGQNRAPSQCILPKANQSQTKINLARNQTVYKGANILPDLSLLWAHAATVVNQENEIQQSNTAARIRGNNFKKIRLSAAIFKGAEIRGGQCSHRLIAGVNRYSRKNEREIVAIQIPEICLKR